MTHLDNPDIASRTEQYIQPEVPSQVENYGIPEAYLSTIALARDMAERVHPIVRVSTIQRLLDGIPDGDLYAEQILGNLEA